MAIFGRITARQRLRRATRESLTIPAFSSPVDCTPWVTGGLWPAQLSTPTGETATLAEHLRADLQRITRSANDELRSVRQAGMPDFARRAEEARIIDDARARAVRRVESTIRQMHAIKPTAPGAHARPQGGEAPDGTDSERTQVIPVVTDDASGARDAQQPAPDPTEVIPVVTDEPPDPPAAPPAPGPEEAVAGQHNGAPVDRPDEPQGRHRVGGEHGADEVASPLPDPAESVAPTESDGERLRRLLAFVVHQEPRLNWAIGECADGTTVVVSDLAHGWIPPGIALPEGVRLLEPERRAGKAAALLGETARTLAYAPGDSLGWLEDTAETKASAQPRELPAVNDVGWELSQATHWRDGLPRMVHTLARAAAAGTGVVAEEIDLLRVHLDTARYQLLIQYPAVDPALLLNCMLLASTEGAAMGDQVSANYHLAWFLKLSAPSGDL